MAEKVKIFIDDVEIEAEAGKTVLQVALENGIDIPYFCYHPRLPIAGACRMCVVYWEDIKRLVISCNLKVQDGMRIRTHRTSELVRNQQKYLLQALMTRHPLDCPICDKAGECDLQNLGAIYGPQKQIVPISPLEKERHEHDWESDFLEYYSNRCVVCYRCIRACNEVVGARALYVEERGFHSNIVPAVRPLDTSTCEMCGICVYVCPVGAILSKPFKFWTRSWLLRKERTYCSFCPVGCEIQVEYGVGDWRSKKKVYRTKPTDELNICARAFFGYDVLNRERLLSCEMFGRQETTGNVANILSNILREEGERTAFILSAYLPREVMEAVVELAEKAGSYITAPQSADFFKFVEAAGSLNLPSPEKLGEYDFVVLVGDDITSTAPVLSYYIKGKVYKVGKSVRDGKLSPEEVDLSFVEKLEGKGAIIVTPHFFGDVAQTAKQIGEIVRSRGFDLFILPKDTNSLILYELLRERYSDLGKLMELAEGGEIKNLIIFGEDILEFYPLSRFEELGKKLEHFVVVSPFGDGLSQYAHIRIPMALMGEQEGSFLTLFGERRVKAFLPWAFGELEFWRSLAESLEGKKGIKVAKGGSTPERIFHLHLYRNNWITVRSENLTKLYEKNKAIESYYATS